MGPPSAVLRLKTAFFSRSIQFMLLALALSTANTYASTLAASLFLARAGTDALPIYYMFFAVLSIPLSLGFSVVIDRWARARTLKAMLTGFAAVSAGLGLAAGTDESSLYALYLGISVCELLTFSVYYVLIADYFTPSESKRFTGTIAICMAGGGLVGGGLVGITMTLLSTKGALLVAPALVILTLGHLAWLTARERPLDETETAPDESLLESIKMQSRLARRYPIVPLLTGAVFLNVLLQCFSEYLAFSIYTEMFTDEAHLATFLGLVNAGMNILGVAVVFIFTNPMIARLGVARFNLIFPAINLAALASVVIDQRLPSAILAHVAYDSLEHSIDIPVFTLNYNAIPHRFVGRIRVVNDGVAYPLALATAGALLLLLTSWLDLAQMAAVAVAIGTIFVAVHWGIGRNYLRSLVDMLRTGAIDLDQAGDGFRLPAQYREDVRAMLASDDPDILGIALEIAARSDFVLTAAELEHALTVVPEDRELSVLHRIARSHQRDAAHAVEDLARSHHARIRAAALEVMASEGAGLSADQAAHHLDDPDRCIRAIATAALWLIERSNALADRILEISRNDPTVALAACRLLGARGDVAALPILTAMMNTEEPSATVAALEAMALLGGHGVMLPLEAIDVFSRHPDATVRGAAIRVLARFLPAWKLIEIARRGLGDTMPTVRHDAATALGARGAESLPALSDALVGPPEQRDAAIEGLGLVGGRAADDALFAFIEPRILDAISGNMALLRRLPAARPGWQALEAALIDANGQAVHLVLQCLAALGYRRTLKVVRTMLARGDARRRSHAVEALAALAHRRYVQPLMPLLEPTGAATVRATDEAARRTLLETALGSEDPYICAGAVLAWHTEFGALPARISIDCRPFVAQTIRELTTIANRGTAAREDIAMNRLVFLKSIPMFSEMTLENLIAIDAAMQRETYLPDEAVVVEGEVGDKLFIVYRGAVGVRKTGDSTDLARLGSGQVFGEMSLFDNEPRSANVVAREDTEVLSLDRDQFHSLAHQRPQIVVEMCKVLVGRLRSAIS